MLTALATVLVGIGLFFYGMRIVGNELRNLSGRNLRTLFAKWTNNKLFAILGGFVSGAITQSTSNASLIITNLVTSRILSVKNAVPVIAASNIGTVLLVFLVVINIKLGVLYLLGIVAILYSLNKKVREKPIMGVILGVAILMFGFNTFVSEAKILFNNPSVKESLLFLKSSYLYYLLPFILGLILRFLTQSTSTVSVIAISLCQTGIIDVNQTLLIVFGAPMGSVLTLLLVSTGFKGAAKQIAFFQILFETTGTLVLTTALALDLLFKLSFLKDFLSHLSSQMAGQIAFALLIMRVVPFILTLIFSSPIIKFLGKLSPPSTEEELITPIYIYDGAIDEPETAMDLLEQEQLRLVERFPNLVENIRTEHEAEIVHEYNMLHSVNLKLQKEIDDFISDMFKNSLGREASERLIKLQNLQNYLTLIEMNLFSFVKEVAEYELGGTTKAFVEKIIESLHLVLVLNHEMTGAKSMQPIQDVIKMTSDKEKLMEAMRKPFLSENNQFTQEDRVKVLNLTNLFQRIIWLINSEAALYSEIYSSFKEKRINRQ